MSENWAITIGINRYNNLPGLKFAVADAESMKQFLQQPKMGFKQVYHFADDAPPLIDERGNEWSAVPSFANLRSFLRRRFEQPFLSEGDNLWFFFAGHGKRHEDRDYLLFNDTDTHVEEITKTAIPLHQITERLRRSGAGNVILFLDACRNETGARSDGWGAEQQQGVITIASCSPKQQSYEIEQLGHGCFTYALLESLEIEGEGNCATVERLCNRLRERIKDLNAAHHKPIQIVYPTVEPASKYHFILLPQQATLNDINQLKVDAYAAEQEAPELAHQLWLRVNVAARGGDMDAIRAFVRLGSRDKKAARPKPEASPSQAVGERSSPAFITKQARSKAAEAELEGLLKLSQSISFKTVRVDARGKVIAQESGKAPVWIEDLPVWIEDLPVWTEDLGEGVSLEMVGIKAGSFMMGSPADKPERYSYEGPQQEVKITTPFLIGCYAVTQAQWKAVAGLPKIERDVERDPSQFKGANHPVERVSWADAQEFCARLTQKSGREYRLPSEAEWEYACRAGTTTPFAFGETITTKLANYRGTDNEKYGWSGSYGEGPKGEYRGETTAVGSFPANAWGLYDMHGNVWEWCEDRWHNSYEGAPADGRAWIDGKDNRRLLRGGSWNDYPRDCRSAVRGWIDAENRDNTFGFRVLLSSPWIVPLPS